MRTRLLTFAVLSAVLAAPDACFAVRIASFPGLDVFVERADVIAVVRIDGHIDPHPGPNLTTEHRCYVYQTLKGDLTKGETVPIELIDTTQSWRAVFRLGSTHVVFLRKETTSTGEPRYRSLAWEGAHIEVSPFGNEKLPEADSVAETIRLLVRRYVDYREKERAREDALIEKVLDP